MSYLNHKKLGAILFVTLFLIIEKACALSTVTPGDDITKHTIVYPRVYEPSEFKSSVSVLFTKLPFDWVETSVDIPILQLEGRLGLPAGFTIDANIQTIVISNIINLGPHWNFSLGKVSLGAGFNGSFMYGKMNVSGFDNEAWGWGMTPNISIGFTANDISFSVKGERKTINLLKITSGSAEISKEKNFNAGWSLGIYMEQRLWKNHVMVLGFINNFQKFYYAAWPAFSTFNRNYYIPQIYIGVVL